MHQSQENPAEPKGSERALAIEAGPSRYHGPRPCGATVSSRSREDRNFSKDLLAVFVPRQFEARKPFPIPKRADLAVPPNTIESLVQK